MGLTRPQAPVLVAAEGGGYTWQAQVKKGTLSGVAPTEQDAVRAAIAACERRGYEAVLASEQKPLTDRVAAIEGRLARIEERLTNLGEHVGKIKTDLER